MSLIPVYNLELELLFKIEKTSLLIEIYDLYCSKYNENDIVHILNDDLYACHPLDWKMTAGRLASHCELKIFIRTIKPTNPKIMKRYHLNIKTVRQQILNNTLQPDRNQPEVMINEPII